MPKASDVTSNRSAPTHVSSLAKWTSQMSMLLRACRQQFPLIKRLLRRIRVQRLARSPRSMTTCVCFGRASEFNIARKTALHCSAKRLSKLLIEFWSFQQEQDSRFWLLWFADVKASTRTFLENFSHRVTPVHESTMKLLIFRNF